jgi:hypothetical protein
LVDVEKKIPKSNQLKDINNLQGLSNPDASRIADELNLRREIIQ